MEGLQGSNHGSSWQSSRAVLGSRAAPLVGAGAILVESSRWQGRRLFPGVSAHQTDRRTPSHSPLAFSLLTLTYPAAFFFILPFLQKAIYCLFLRFWGLNPRPCTCQFSTADLRLQPYWLAFGTTLSHVLIWSLVPVSSGSQSPNLLHSETRATSYHGVPACLSFPGPWPVLVSLFSCQPVK